LKLWSRSRRKSERRLPWRESKEDLVVLEMPYKQLIARSTPKAVSSNSSKPRAKASHTVIKWTSTILIGKIEKEY
jgi:hypothetical protein